VTNHLVFEACPSAHRTRRLRPAGTTLYWPNIRISITAAAFEALAATMPLGSVGYEPEPNAKGERWIWLEPRFVDRLRALCGPGESYSDVILRTAKG
jgi:hypothetical protein